MGVVMKYSMLILYGLIVGTMLHSSETSANNTTLQLMEALRADIQTVTSLSTPELRQASFSPSRTKSIDYSQFKMSTNPKIQSLVPQIVLFKSNYLLASKATEQANYLEKISKLSSLEKKIQEIVRLSTSIPFTPVPPMSVQAVSTLALPSSDFFTALYQALRQDYDNILEKKDPVYGTKNFYQDNMQIIKQIAANSSLENLASNIFLFNIYLSAGNISGTKSKFDIINDIIQPLIAVAPPIPTPPVAPPVTPVIKENRVNDFQKQIEDRQKELEEKRKKKTKILYPSLQAEWLKAFDNKDLTELEDELARLNREQLALVMSKGLLENPPPQEADVALVARLKRIDDINDTIEQLGVDIDFVLPLIKKLKEQLQAQEGTNSDPNRGTTQDDEWED